MSDARQYTSRYFSGMKVEVGIPLPNSQVFRDWAIINEIDEDLVSLQLSRDMLPDGVSLRVGQNLTITSESEGQIWSCRAYIVSKGYEQDLLLSLIGELVYEELREFYRIDAFLPIKFYTLHDQDSANVKKEWNDRRKQRQDEERAREQKRLEAKLEKLRSEERERKQKLVESVFPIESTEQLSSHVESQEEPEEQQYDDSWSSVTAVAVNISGGGLKILTGQEFNMDEFILLEIFVPSSRTIADIIARVVFSSHSDAAGDDHSYFNTGMKFVFIDESSRFAINSHISRVQIKRIQQFKGFADVEPLGLDNIPMPDKHYAYIDRVAASDHIDNLNQIDRKNTIQQIVLGLFLVCIVILISFYFSGYADKHPKNEIQDIFENSIRKLRGNLMQR